MGSRIPLKRKLRELTGQAATLTCLRRQNDQEPKADTGLVLKRGRRQILISWN